MREERISVAAEEVRVSRRGPDGPTVRNGILIVSNGPAVNADAFLTGYFLIEVESSEAAIDWVETRFQTHELDLSKCGQSWISPGRRCGARSDQRHEWLRLRQHFRNTP